MISGIILASGLSKRMGADKLLFNIGGVPVIERVIAAASKSKLGEIILVCSRESTACIGRRYGVKIVSNNAPHLGQSHSIRLGVENSCQSTDGFMFLVGDQPFINESIINELIESFTPEKCSAVVPLYNGTRGNPVIFATHNRDKLLSLSGDSGGRVLLEELKGRVVTVGFADEKSGLDIDTQEEYEEVIKLEGKNG
jgi:molybdenum cofactor cytidylyltransferase